MRTKASLATMIERWATATAANEASAKLKFRAHALASLGRLAKALKWEAGSFDLKFNPGGPAVSGEAVLHSEHWYVCVNGNDVNGCHVLYRTCRGRKDSTGGMNRWASTKSLESGELAKRMAEIRTPVTA